MTQGVRYGRRRTIFLWAAAVCLACMGAGADPTQAWGAAPQPEIDRVSPPFWWVGFKDKRLQLTLHGREIARFSVESGDPSVTVSGVQRTENPNYLFVDLMLADTAVPGAVDLVFRDGADSFTLAYDLRSRRAGSAGRRGFDSSDAIYLITPDRFANGSAANDTAAGMTDGLNRTDKDGRHGGDIQGIIDHLGYISDLGFTAVWATPLLENNQPQTSYHGYAITDFYKVDPRFGSNADYLKLSAEARARGLGLIMDMVANHIGSEHWWMKDLPSADWLNFPPGQGMENYVQSNHARSTLHDPHAAQRDRARFSGGWFAPAMPDLNQKNPLVATYLIENALWWIEYADLAGIRMDTYSYPDMDFMAAWAGRIRAEYPDFTIVGEEYVLNPALVSFWQEGAAHSGGYASNLPSVMDFPLQDAMARGLREPEGWDTGLRRMYDALANDFLYPAPDRLVIFPDNHDMARLFTQLGEDIDLYKMAIGYIATMRGIPEIYYGTEILKTSPGPKDDGIIRSDFPGGWPGDPANGFTGAGLSADQREAQAFLRTLMTWRKGKDVIHTGALTHFIPEDGTYVFFRHDGHDKVMVAFNKNSEPHALGLSRFAEVLGAARRGRDVLSGEAVSLEGTLTLKPRSVTIIEVEP